MYDAPHIIFYCIPNTYFFTPPRWKITRFNIPFTRFYSLCICACRFNLNVIEYIVDPPAGATAAAMCRIDNAVNSLLLYFPIFTEITSLARIPIMHILQYCFDWGRIQLGPSLFYNRKYVRKCENFPCIQTFH